VAPMFSDGGSSLALAPVGCAFWPMIARSPAGAALQHTTLLRQPSVNKRLCAATHPGVRQAHSSPRRRSSVWAHLCSTVFACSSCHTQTPSSVCSATTCLIPVQLQKPFYTHSHHTQPTCSNQQPETDPECPQHNLPDPCPTCRRHGRGLRGSGVQRVQARPRGGALRPSTAEATSQH